MYSLQPQPPVQKKPSHLMRNLALGAGGLLAAGTGAYLYGKNSPESFFGNFSKGLDDNVINPIAQKFAPKPAAPQGPDPFEKYVHPERELGRIMRTTTPYQEMQRLAQQTQTEGVYHALSKARYPSDLHGTVFEKGFFARDRVTQDLLDRVQQRVQNNGAYDIADVGKLGAGATMLTALGLNGVVGAGNLATRFGGPATSTIGKNVVSKLGPVTKLLGKSVPLAGAIFGMPDAIQLSEKAMDRMGYTHPTTTQRVGAAIAAMAGHAALSYGGGPALGAGVGAVTSAALGPEAVPVGTAVGAGIGSFVGPSIAPATNMYMNYYNNDVTNKNLMEGGTSYLRKALGEAITRAKSQNNNVSLKALSEMIHPGDNYSMNKDIVERMQSPEVQALINRAY